MNEYSKQAAQSVFEDRSRALFHDSVDGIDARLRSRLNRARHAALEAAASAASRPWFSRSIWTPAAGVSVAVLLGVALWFGVQGHHGMQADANLEDLDMVAASDGGSSDDLEMLQDDLEFYDFADKAATSEPEA